MLSIKASWVILVSLVVAFFSVIFGLSGNLPVTPTFLVLGAAIIAIAIAVRIGQSNKDCASVTETELHLDGKLANHHSQYIEQHARGCSSCKKKLETIRQERKRKLIREHMNKTS